MKLPIYLYGHPVLRNASNEITPEYPDLKKLIEDMYETMYASEGVGLAAPQIGINKKIFTILANDLEGKTWLLAVINPKIVKKSKEVVFLPGGEGCLSVDRETCGITPRHKRITVEADLYNVQTGKIDHKRFDLVDYIAIVFQHEYDHLFGTLYVDTIIDEEGDTK